MGPIEIHRVPGDHFSMLRRPRVSRLAEIVRDVVSRGSPPRSEGTETQRGES
ncbi:MAG TPA: hypothetical protein VLS89_00650 [Candidatus Nanopelagicales bacterium]|nr:hypothetical protein [Candidatus Nanopelagicales bacterium]